MGMFAYVNHPMPCQSCGKQTNNWQTKDLDDLYLQTVSVERIAGGMFYGPCAHCEESNTWHVRPTGYRLISPSQLLAEEGR